MKKNVIVTAFVTLAVLALFTLTVSMGLVKNGRADGITQTEALPDSTEGPAAPASAAVARLTYQINLSVISQALVATTPQTLDIEAEQGTEAPFSLGLTNTGSVAVTYVFTSIIPAGVNIQVVLDDATYTRTVGPGAVDTLDGVIRVGADVPTGAYSIDIELY
jgi:hypothetical protein